MELKSEDKLVSISMSWLKTARKFHNSIIAVPNISAIQATNGKDFTMPLIDLNNMVITIEMQWEWNLNLKPINTEAQAPYEKLASLQILKQ